jgi:hypothetical protein
MGTVHLGEQWIGVRSVTWVLFSLHVVTSPATPHFRPKCVPVFAFLSHTHTHTHTQVMQLVIWNGSGGDRDKETGNEKELL